MDEEKEIYLKVGRDIVGKGSEADMVNLAAQYDYDYELLDEEDLSDEDWNSPFFDERKKEDDE